MILRGSEILKAASPRNLVVPSIVIFAGNQEVESRSVGPHFENWQPERKRGLDYLLHWAGNERAAFHDVQQHASRPWGGVRLGLNFGLNFSSQMD